MFFRTNVVRMFEDFTGHYEHFCGSLHSVYMKKQNSLLRHSGADFREKLFRVKEMWLDGCKLEKNFIDGIYCDFGTKPSEKSAA